MGRLLLARHVVVHAALVPYARKDAHEVNVTGLSTARRGSSGPSADALHLPFKRIRAPECRVGVRARQVRDPIDAHRAPGASPSDPASSLAMEGSSTGSGPTLRRSPIVPLVGGGHQPVQTVHIDDLVAAIDASIRQGRSGVLTVAERDSVEFRALLSECARLMRRRVLFLPVPVRPLAAALRLAELVRLRLPVSRDNLLGLQSTERADIDHELEGLGVNVRDYRVSLAAILGHEARG